VRVAVTGSSGLIGAALLPALRDAGHEVLVLVRREPRAPDEVGWDPAAGALAAERLRGLDAVVHLAGATIGRRWTAGRKREILESRTKPTRLLAEALAELEPRPRALVSASAIGFYGDRGDEQLSERSGRGEGFLAEVVEAWEAAAQPARDAGIRVVNLRQGLVLSRDGGALQRLLTPFRLGVGGRIGSGRQWWSWVAPADVVGAYLWALEAPDAAGAVNVTAPHPVTNAEFARALGRALRRPSALPLPAAAVRLLLGEMGEELLLASQRVLPVRLEESGYEFAAPELEDALEATLAR
jgi:uncharacterized protein (TIGR01777 family)